VLALLVFANRYLRAVVSEQVYDQHHFLSFFLKMYGSVKADRFIANPEFIGVSTDILKSGGVIEIYPEAKLQQKGQKEINEFKISVILMALQSKAKIIPVYQNANFGFLRRVTVVIGTPIDICSMCTNPNPSIQELQQLASVVRNKMIQLQKMAQKYEK
jgi:1-acyl-sn-glycerol-3-phosphate acyltransferase